MREVNIGIYKITNVTNGKVYVGSASRSFNRRKTEHFKTLRKNKHSNMHLQRAFNEYGEENFRFEILERISKPECEIQFKDLICEIEQKWMEKLNVLDRHIGYNIAPIAGSMIGYKHTEETKEKLRAIHRGKILSEEHKKNMSISRTGKILSKESKIKIGIMSSLKTMSPESRLKISISKKGVKLSSQTRLRMSQSRTGSKHHFFGKSHTENTKDKISKSRKGKRVGSMNPNSKLTEKMVREIKEMLLVGISGSEIGRRYFIHRDTISNIKTGKTWKQVVI